MGYLGLTPTTAQQNYLNIDDISGSFNGTTTSFALQVGGVAPTPFPVTNSCLISVGGVVQQPDDTGTDGFRISGGNIIFSSAPGTGEDFFGLVLAGADYLNVGANFPDGTVGTPSITFDGDTNTGIYHPSADELSFVTGGSDRVRVDSNGRLGIGTTSPASSLNFGDAAANSGIQFGDSADFTIKRNTTDTTIDFNVGSDLNHFQWKVGGINYMRLDSSGRLGIGTTSPSSYFANRLVVDIDSSSQNGITIKSGSTAQGIICFADGTSGTERYSGYIDYHHNTNVLSFGTNSGNERFRLGPAGQFGIGGANYGTSGQVLTSQGNAAAPQWASVVTTTNVADLSSPAVTDVTVTGIPASATNTVIALTNVSNTNSGTPQLNLQMGNGSLSSSDYYWTTGYNTAWQSGGATSSIRLTSTDFNNSSNTWSGIIHISESSGRMAVIAQLGVKDSALTMALTGATWAGGGTIDRVRIWTQGGNFTNGRMSVHSW